MPPFCGREDHLATLLSRWREVKQGVGPRVVVLLAESGLGKTRLAQEFYARLVQTEQAEGGYWPAELGTDGNNLLVNPPPAGWNAAAEMPFLWWGVRLSDPVGRNQVATGALAAHVDGYLVPHLEPFHREQRRRQRLGQLAKMGGAVAVDAVLDLVPVLSLIKKAGEVGLELKGIHDSWRKDRQALDAATLLGQRRDSLVDQLLGDLGKLFDGPSGRTVPAVILVDDAQFSNVDPGVTAFVQALLKAMAAGDWPLLLLVTHWEREFAEAADGEVDASVAAIIARQARLRPERVEVLRLAPIAGLEPLVTERLPGLPAAQVARLTERAGGNPQYLDEIVRLTLDPRSRAWFEGRDPTGALTDAGLETLLAKSVKLQDVVAERFANSPAEVQEAVALAGVQGAEFLGALVELTHRGLAGGQVGGRSGGASAGQAVDQAGGRTEGQADDRAYDQAYDRADGRSDDDDVAHALADACQRHGYVAWLTEERGAFSQRIYQDVAREFLPVFHDEAAAEAALRAVVAQVLLGELPLPVTADAERALMRLAANLFETSDDEEERRLAAHGLHRLTLAASTAGELQVAHGLAVRQAALLEGISDARQDGDLAWLRATNDVLATAADTEARRSVLTRLVRLTGEAYEDDVNTWSAALYAQVLMDVAEFHEEAGAQELRSEAINAAVSVVQSLDGFEPKVEVLEASLRLHRMYAAWFDEYGRLDDALETYRYALGVANQLLALEDDPVRRLQAATVQSEVGTNALLRGDARGALPDLEQAAATLRALAEGAVSVDLDIRLSTALDHLADAYSATGRPRDAEALLVEVLELMRRHLSLAPDAPRTMANVADALERLTVLQQRLGAGEAAAQHIREAVALRRTVAERSRALPDYAMLGYSLTRAGEIVGSQGAVAEGHEYVTEAVDLSRRVCASDTRARAAWRLLLALKVALDYALHRTDLEAARELLAEVDAVKGRLEPDALTPITPYLRDIEEQRARVLEESGDAEGAARVRAGGRVGEGGAVN
jgi:tetratricopeptide (TPR) repeat protein